MTPTDPIVEPRQREVLKSLIREHIVTGEPVGSRTVSKGLGLDLSAATIRNIMSDLEERGFLVQPHTSAGRVPTDRAYRLWVDRWMGRSRIAPKQTHAIDEALGRSRGEIPELLEEASRQLSQISHHVGVVLAPEMRRIVVEHLEFVRLGPTRVVAILVGRSGVVHNRILEIDEPVEQSELDHVGRWLSEQYTGRTLPDIREELLRRVTEERAAYSRMAAKALELGRLAVELDRSDTDVFIKGTSNLLDSPEFSDVERMRGVFRTLEQKSRLVNLLGRLIDSDGVQVVIGEENPDEELSDCSVVASSYRSGERVMGTVGIVGPTRMQYARAVALVDYLAQVLTRLLSEPTHRGNE